MSTILVSVLALAWSPASPLPPGPLANAAPVCLQMALASHAPGHTSIWFGAPADAGPVHGRFRMQFLAASPCLAPVMNSAIVPAHPLAVRPAFAADQSAAVGAASQRPMAFQYSDGYRMRAKIHKTASYATLPLFGVQAYLGQQLFNDLAQAGSAKRSWHNGIAWAIGGLFGVNSVTGVWNLMEARKDPNGLVLRTVHGVLMLVADAGFVATAFTSPSLRSEIYDAKKNQHMALAYASVSVATVGYLIMLFGK